MHGVAISDSNTDKVNAPMTAMAMERFLLLLKQAAKFDHAEWQAGVFAEFGLDFGNGTA